MGQLFHRQCQSSKQSLPKINIRDPIMVRLVYENYYPLSVICFPSKPKSLKKKELKKFPLKKKKIPKIFAYKILFNFVLLNPAKLSTENSVDLDQAAF